MKKTFEITCKDSVRNQELLFTGTVKIESEQDLTLPENKFLLCILVSTKLRELGLANITAQGLADHDWLNIRLVDDTPVEENISKPEEPIDAAAANPESEEEEMIYVPKPGAQGELGYGYFEKNPNFRRRIE
jgi:hypothetical protein